MLSRFAAYCPTHCTHTHARSIRRQYIGALGAVVRALAAQFNDGALASAVVVACVAGKDGALTSSSAARDTVAELASLCAPRGVCVHQLFVTSAARTGACSLSRVCIA